MVVTVGSWAVGDLEGRHDGRRAWGDSRTKQDGRAEIAVIDPGREKEGLDLTRGGNGLDGKGEEEAGGW